VEHASTAGAIPELPEGQSKRIKASDAPAQGAGQRPSEDEGKRREQFEALAMPLLDRLYAMALHLVREPARADDMVQETYLRAWQNFDRFTLGTHFKAWIFQILTYLFLNDRRSAHRREASVDFSEHDVIEARPEPDRGQIQAPAANWDELYPHLVDDVLKRALDRLGAEQRTVFLLVTLGELSYQECADILQVPIGTVMSRLFRARKQLQEELAVYAKERGVWSGGIDEDSTDKKDEK
jgi:RNA polymerase sigma-70 factor, ECF subfamily